MSSPDEKNLLAAEEARRQAMLAHDTVALGALLADSLVYVHSTGARDSKSSYLQKLESGQLRYEAVAFVAPDARVAGSTGLVTATMRATALDQSGNRRQIANSWLAIWQHSAAGWRLQHLQATPLP